MSEDPAPAPALRRKLDPADLELIRNALVDGYSVAELKNRLLYKWGIRLDRKLNLDAPGGSELLFAQLVDYTERQGRTLDLLGLAWSGNTGNDMLAEAARRLIPDQDGVLALYGDRRALPARPASLEAVVNERSTITDIDAFLDKYGIFRKAICRIETPFTKGTGFLVGTQHVLTNYHVIERVADNLPLGEHVTCRFDFHGADVAEDGGTPMRLAADWLGPYSRYSASDRTGTGEPAAGELDFALLRLAAPIAERAPLLLSREPRVVVPGDIAMVAQHPKGGKLAIGYGVVVAFPATGLRYRYDCVTEPGSSGAPMFTADLDLAGLHHAADPASAPRYNQAVPTFLVARAIEAAGLDPRTL